MQIIINGLPEEPTPRPGCLEIVCTVIGAVVMLAIILGGVHF